MTTETSDSCPVTDLAPVLAGEVAVGFVGGLPERLVGRVLAADFPIEQDAGYIVTECDEEVVLHRLFSTSSLSVGGAGVETTASFATTRDAVATIGWETFTSIRIGDEIIDLRSGEITPIEDSDDSIRTFGKTVSPDGGSLFRYVSRDIGDSGCDSPQIWAENQQTGDQTPALPAAIPSWPIERFKTNGIGGLAVWTTRCEVATTLNWSTVSPETGALLESLQILTVEDGALSFTLSVQGALIAWNELDIANGDFDPIVQIDLVG